MLVDFWKDAVPRKKIEVKLRSSGETFVEKVYGDEYMRLFYGSEKRMFFTGKLLTNRLISEIYGAYNDSGVSKHKIEKFVSELEIDVDECEKPLSEYHSFNDFFARKLKEGCRTIDPGGTLVSPGDGRILVFPLIESGMVTYIKWAPIELSKLFGPYQTLYQKYEGGSCAVLRLCPADYHRFHFPAAGKAGMTRTIPGLLHSVSPYALEMKKPVFAGNKRTLCELRTREFGQVLIMEVGALFVGSIVQTYRAGMEVKKGDEKGYFKFGGSTVILFFEKGVMAFDDDLVENSRLGFETKVLMGERIARQL